MMGSDWVRRATSAGIDLLAFLGTWLGVAFVIATVLSWRYPDNPWGNLAFAIMWGFVAALGLLMAVEARTDSPGRAITGLRLQTKRGDDLSRARKVLRALFKFGTWGTIVAFTGNLPLGALLAVLLVPVAANAAVIASRDDRRSLLDLAVGSRSVR